MIDKMIMTNPRSLTITTMNREDGSFYDQEDDFDEDRNSSLFPGDYIRTNTTMAITTNTIHYHD